MGAQLTEGWWKTAWPSKTPPKSFGEMKLAIKSAKQAKRGTSVMDYHSALHHLGHVIDKLEKEADAQFKTAPMDKRTARGNLSDLRKLMEKELAGAKMGAAPIVVFNKPYGKLLKEKVSDNSQLQPLGRMDIKLELMVGLVNELRDKNAEAMLNTRLNKAFDASLDQTVKHVDKALKIHGGVLPQAVLRDLTRILDDEADKLAAEFRKIPAEVLRKIGINEKMALKYGLNKGASVVSTGAGTVLAGVGIGLPGTQAFAIAASVRAAVGFITEITSACAKIETKIGNLDHDLVLLRNAFGTADAKARKMGKGDTLAELTLSTVNTLIGRDLLVTVKSADSQIKDIEGHLAYLENRCQKLQGQIADALDKEAKLSAKALKTWGKKKMTSVFRNIQLGHARKSLDGVLKDAHALAVRLNKADLAVTKLRREMKLLKDPGQGLKALQTTVDLMINIGVGIGGVGDAASVGKDGPAVLVAIAGVYDDMGNKLNDLG